MEVELSQQERELHSRLHSIPSEVEGSSKESFLEEAQATLLRLSLTKHTSYQQELQTVLDDLTFYCSEFYALYFLLIVLKNLSVERKMNNLEGEVDQHYECDIQQIPFTSLWVETLQYLRTHHPTTYSLVDHLEWGQFKKQMKLSELGLKDKVVVLLHYLINNNLRSLFKELVSVLPLGLVTSKLVSDPRVNRFENSFFMDVVYSLAYRHNLDLNDTQHLQNYYYSFRSLSFLSPDDDLKGSNFFNSLNQTRNYSCLVQLLIQHGFQFIIIRLIVSLDQMVPIEAQHLQMMIDQKMFQLIKEISMTKQFRNLIQYDLIFNKLILEEGDQEMLMHQVSLLNHIQTHRMVQMTQERQQAIYLKYHHLMANPSLIHYAHYNPIYLLCAVSLLLLDLIDNKHNRYQVFKNLSQDYLHMACHKLNKINEIQTMYLVLFYKNHLQDTNLITFLFKNTDHFNNMLNEPMVYKVLYKVWTGNRQYSRNFLEESYHYQVLFTNYQLVVDDVLYYGRLPSMSYQQQFNASLQQGFAQVMGKKQKHDIADIEHRYLLSQDEPSASECLAQYQEEFKSQNEELKAGLEKSKKVFEYIRSDETKEEMKANQLYQFSIYLSNLKIKKVYNVVVFIIFILLYSSVVWSSIDSLTPFIQLASHQQYYDLLGWKVDTKIQNKVTVNTKLAQEYKKFLKSKDDQYFMKIMTNQTLYDEMLELRLATYDFSDEELEKKFIYLCKEMNIFNKYIYLGKLGRFQLICIFNVLICFQSFIDIIYQFMSQGKLVINLTHLIDIGIIGVQMMMINANYRLMSIYVFDEFLLMYYRCLQFTSIVIIWFLYIRILESIKFFKRLGIFVIIVRKIILKITYFLVYMLLVILVMTTIFYMLFRLIDQSFNTAGSTLGKMLVIPLGNINLQEIKQNSENPFFIGLENGMIIFVAYMLMVVLLNIMIAMMSNMYQEVVDYTENEFSQLMFTDYLLNQPNKYYSCLNNCPIWLSFILLPLLPFILFFRSKRLNQFLNSLFYLIKLFLPFLLVYWTLNLLLTPFTYLKILYSILFRPYLNHEGKNVPQNTKRLILFFFQFLLLGWLYLIYKVLVLDTIYLTRKAWHPVPYEIETVFSPSLYRLFKLSVRHLLPKATVSSQQLIQQMQHFRHEMPVGNSPALDKQMAVLGRKLPAQVDLEHFRSILSLIKNRRVLKYEVCGRASHQKLYQLEIVLGSFS